jgi:hypothetical protein
MVMRGDDLARMRAAATALRGDREMAITLVRDGLPLPAQAVRLCYLGNRTILRQNPETGQTTIPLLVKGPRDLDIQVGDRFSDPAEAGVYYVIDLVRPDRSVETTAEARVQL